MIDRDHMIEPMLVACPSFEPRWHEFLDEWVGNPILFEDGSDGELPMYLALGDLANHLIEKLESGETKDFPTIFGVVEDWNVHGEHYVAEAATIGLIEDLTNEHRYRRLKPDDMLPWLGPESAKSWHALLEFWERLDKERSILSRVKEKLAGFFTPTSFVSRS
ncbi:MAG: hypothetical protein M3Q57_03495 [Pseudomonadota bacterium]|nr:hypothetical protein [Pseudomonadota bacterium]